MTTLIKSSFVICMGLFLMQGCGSSNSSGDTTMITVGDSSNALATLSMNTQSIKPVLMQEPWKVISTDIASFYENTNLPTFKSYTIDISFGENDIVAYADCQKLTARYTLKDKEISFSWSTITPAIELASCAASEYADEAVLALLSNDFTVESLLTDEVVLQAVDFDTKVTLKR